MPIVMNHFQQDIVYRFVRQPVAVQSRYEIAAQKKLGPQADQPAVLLAAAMFWKRTGPKLSPSIARKIRALYDSAEPYSYRALAVRFGVTKNTIYKVMHNQIYKVAV